MMAAHQLLKHHREALINDRAISDWAVEGRGYFSATTKEQLAELGFKGAQLKRLSLPGLVLPIWNITGRIVSHLYRPDAPDVVPKTNRMRKYERIAGTANCLDVPPLVGEMLHEAAPEQLIFTEGVQKADAAASQGLLCVDLIGVFNFRGKDKSGRKRVIPDFEALPLEGLDCYIAYDSDVMTKPEVLKAVRIYRRPCPPSSSTTVNCETTAMMPSKPSARRMKFRARKSSIAEASLVASFGSKAIRRSRRS
jgi:uncharacterized protein DUF3854